VAPSTAFETCYGCPHPQVRAARGLPDDLVRISAGIEDVHDLLGGALSTRTSSLSILQSSGVLVLSCLRHQLYIAGPSIRMLDGYGQVCLRSCHTDLDQAMQKATAAVGMAPQKGAASPYSFARGAAEEAATLRAQVQQLQAELAAVRAA
jgi:Cys/Met metabolism PLP-dependent enzyme